MVKITREEAYQRILRRNEEIKAIKGYNFLVHWDYEPLDYGGMIVY